MIIDTDMSSPMTGAHTSPIVSWKDDCEPIAFTIFFGPTHAFTMLGKGL